MEAPVENEVTGRQTVQVKNRDKIRWVAVKYRERGMPGDMVPESVATRKAVEVIYFLLLFWILAKTQSLHIKKYHKLTFFFSNSTRSVHRPPSFALRNERNHVNIKNII
jgi:hypothetical protein